MFCHCLQKKKNPSFLPWIPCDLALIISFMPSLGTVTLILNAQDTLTCLKSVNNNVNGATLKWSWNCLVRVLSQIFGMLKLGKITIGLGLGQHCVLKHCVQRYQENRYSDH